MGYYSDVRFNTNKAGYQEFLSYLPDEFKDPFDWGLFDTEGKPEAYDEDGDSVIFGWWDKKWYTDYGTTSDGRRPFADVEAVMDAFNRVVDNGEHPIEYIRIGEDEFDVEHLGSTFNERESLSRHLESRISVCVW